MILQEDWGISHQQLPVIDMLLFSCDLFFRHSDSQGKNKPAHSINHNNGDHSWVSNKIVYILGTEFQTLLCQGLKYILARVSDYYLVHNVQIT